MKKLAEGKAKTEGVVKPKQWAAAWASFSPAMLKMESSNFWFRMERWDSLSRRCHFLLLQFAQAHISEGQVESSWSGLAQRGQLHAVDPTYLAGWPWWQRFGHLWGRNIQFDFAISCLCKIYFEYKFGNIRSVYMAAMTVKGEGRWVGRVQFTAGVKGWAGSMKQRKRGRWFVKGLSLKPRQWWE